MSQPKSRSNKPSKKKRRANDSKADETKQGRVIKPLIKRPKRSTATKAKLSSKTKNKSSKQLKSKKTHEQEAYVSYKNRKKTLFSGASGASNRANVRQDLIRFQIVWMIALFGFAALIARASYLQLISPEFYMQKGEGFITTTQSVPAFRGMIVDRNEQPLAISAPITNVHFSPHDYATKYYATKAELIKAQNKNKPKRVRKWQERLDEMDLRVLANAAGVSVETLQQAVAIDPDLIVIGEGSKERIEQALPKGEGSHYLPLFRRVTPEVAKAVTDLNFAGVHDVTEYRRYYPQPQPNAQLLGFMSQNSEQPEKGYAGRAGIELKYDEILSGKSGKRLLLKDGSTHDGIKELQQLEAQIPGQDIRLTVDARLQYLLYNELEAVGRVQQARWATGMVVDVQTGEVLAMSTWPAFNNNDLGKMTGENQRNRALIDTFEPGSVMKPFTVAAALASGEYNANSIIDTTPGYIRVKGYNIRDHNNLGRINMTTLLQKSSNVASTKIALSLPADAISNMQKQFGFGQKTHLVFPAEKSGVIPTPDEKETSRRATISYGYGLEVTLAQIAQAYATLGSGGVLNPLTISKDDKQPPAQRIIAQEDADAIVAMMETVTQTGGTATAAAIDGYRVAGKTGTSRRVSPEGGYYEGQYRTIFAGIAPASNPRLAAVILVEDPQENYYAGLVAAPVFKNVMQEALRLYNVPLDKPLRAKDQPLTPSEMAAAAEPTVPLLQASNESNEADPTTLATSQGTP